nr:hypothetical protein BCU62_07455 [Enterovibrio norvegicus]
MIMLRYPDKDTLKKNLLDKRRKELDGQTQDAIAHLILELDDPETMLAISTRFIAERLDVNRVDGGFSSRTQLHYRPTQEFRDAEELPSMVNAVFPNKHRSLQTIWRSKKPVIFHNIALNPLLNGIHDAVLATEVKSMMALSLGTHHKDIGILCIDQCDRERVWTTKEQVYIHELAKNILSPLFDASQTSAISEHCLLSDAELNVVRLAAEGMSYVQIADTLHKSVRTIENQLRSARHKTGAQNQTDLVRRCINWF